MIKKVSKTETIKDRLLKEGKTKLLNNPEHIEAIENMNKRLEKFRREYHNKNWKVNLLGTGVVC